MPKIKLTKNELKRQKEARQRFLRYLPMLQLKKQQLQLEVSRLQRAVAAAANKLDSLRRQLTAWVDCFAQEANLTEILTIGRIKTSEGNIAGIDIPLFKGIELEEKPYDFLLTPLWVDEALVVWREALSLKGELLVLHRALEILREELTIVTQRVNLFEKVKIPQIKENIRVIQIYLGDLETASVVRGKIAKAKLEKRREFSEVA